MGKRNKNSFRQASGGHVEFAQHSPRPASLRPISHDWSSTGLIADRSGGSAHDLSGAPPQGLECELRPTAEHACDACITFM